MCKSPSTLQVRSSFKMMAQAFTLEHESPVLLQHELQLVKSAPAAPDMHSSNPKVNIITREVGRL